MGIRSERRPGYPTLAAGSFKGQVLKYDPSAADGAAWGVPPPRPIPAPRSGRRVFPIATAKSTGLALTLGRQYLYPLDLQSASSFAGIVTRLSTAAAGGTTPAIRVGVYADDGTYQLPTGAPITGTTQNYDPTTGTSDLYTAWGAPVTLGPGRLWLSHCLVSGSAFTTAPLANSINPLTDLDHPDASNLLYQGWYIAQSTTLAALGDITGATFVGGGAPFPIVGLVGT